jgi:hypothetical protein
MPKLATNVAIGEGGKMVVAVQQVNARRNLGKSRTERANSNRKAREEAIAECEQRKDHERRRMEFRASGNDEAAGEDDDDIIGDSDPESDDDEQVEDATVTTLMKSPVDTNNVSGTVEKKERKCYNLDK